VGNLIHVTTANFAYYQPSFPNRPHHTILTQQMATAKVVCPGCGREFAPKGFANHLRLSDDPQCHRFRDELIPNYSATLLDLPTHSLDSHAAPDVPMLDVSNEEPEPGTIPSPPPSHLHSIPIDNIMEDEDNMDFENEAGNFEDEAGRSQGEAGNSEDEVGDFDDSLGEIFHRPSRPPVTVTDLDIESESSDEEGEELQPHPTTQGPSSTQPGKDSYVMIDLPLTTIQAQNNNNPFVIKFGGRAGEALPEQPKHTGYEEYSYALGAEDDINEWTPFSTRTEWEIARWAKLRGPSSTALSELLKIDGVSEMGLSNILFNNFLLGC
jgi:hypothetical protein